MKFNFLQVPSLLLFIVFTLFFSENISANYNSTMEKKGKNSDSNEQNTILKESSVFEQLNYRDSSNFNLLVKRIGEAYKTASFSETQNLLSNILKNNKTLTEKRRMYLLEESAHLYFAAGKPEQATETLKEYLNLLKKSGDTLKIAKTLGNLGMLNRTLGNYKEALQNYVSALEYARSLPGKEKIPVLINVYQSLGNLHRSIKNFDQSIKYLNKSLELAKRTSDSIRMAMLFNDMGSAYIEKGDTAEAKRKYLEAIRINEKYNNIRMLEHNYGNIANILSEQNRANEALNYYLKALNIAQTLHDSLQLDNLYNNISINFNKLNDLEKAENYGLKAVETAKKTGSKLYLYDILFNLSDIYAKKQMYNKAYKYLLESYEVKDTLLNRENLETINNLREKYKAEKNALQIEKLKSEKEQVSLKNKLLVLILVSAALVIILLVLLLFFIHEKRKKEKLMLENKRKIEEQKRILTEKELEKEKLKEQYFKNELSVKTRQLTSHSLNMIQKNRILQDILANLKRMKREGYSENELQNLIRNLEISQKSEKDWELFQKYFEEVDHGFFENIVKLQPRLSNNDIRLCALIKLKLSNKEIATMMNITPQSVKVAKNRLRKKLNIQQGGDICSLLQL
jgi:tetratricopeptide (TPR) repeat protein